jgi:hypothetical protein
MVIVVFLSNWIPVEIRKFPAVAFFFVTIFYFNNCIWYNENTKAVSLKWLIPVLPQLKSGVQIWDYFEVDIKENLLK